MRTVTLLLLALLMSGCAAARLARLGSHADDVGRAATHADDLARAGSHADDAARAGAHADDVAPAAAAAVGADEALGPRALDLALQTGDAAGYVLDGGSALLEQDLEEPGFAEFMARTEKGLAPGPKPGEGAPTEVAQGFADSLKASGAVAVSKAEPTGGTWVQWARSGDRTWVMAWDPQTRRVQTVRRG